MEIGAGSGQETCGRATQNASKIEKVEEKINGCSAQEAEIEPPAKTRLEPKKPSKGLGGREALGSRERPWKIEVLGGAGKFLQALAGPGRPGRLWQVAGPGKAWQALASPGKPWQPLAGPGRAPASGGPVLFLGHSVFCREGYYNIYEAVRLVNPCRLDKGSARPRLLTFPGRLEDWSPAVRLARHACSTPSLVLGGLAAARCLAGPRVWGLGFRV